MASDESYADFLAKANQPTPPSKSPLKSSHGDKSPASTPSTAAALLPPSLQNLPDTYMYTSDTDAPFETLTLPYSAKKLPSAAQFAECFTPAWPVDAVEELSVLEFDPRREYDEVIAKVRHAGQGGVTVFRIQTSRTRAEYYVVTVSEVGLVGVKADAVES